MALPTHFRRRPWTLLLCLGVAPAAVWAEATDWNCKQQKDGQAWECKDPRPAVPKRAEPRQDAAPDENRKATVPAPDDALRAPAPFESLFPQEPDLGEEPEPHSDQPGTEAAPAPTPTRRLTGKQAAAAAELKQGPASLEAPPAAGRAAPALPPTRSGWTCAPGENGDADEGGKSWNCSLAGADPRGTAHVVGADGVAEPTVDWTESGTITPEDEARFQTMMSRLPADPWKNVCAAAVTGIRRKQPPVAEFVVSKQDQEARGAAPMDIHSDYFEMLNGEVANFSGNAEMVKADQKLWGDYVTRNLKTSAVNAHGNIFYQEKGMALSGDTGLFNASTDRGVFRNTQFIMPAGPVRGISRLTHLDSATLSRYENFSYTTCPPGDRSWMLHADTVKLNKETGQGTARDAWLEFKGVPFFYTPYLSFPTDSRRQTGFLSPSVNYTNYAGFNVMAPYYFNLAPNYDYTVAPRYLVKRGFQFNNEFRYMTEMTRGRIVADLVPYDIEADSENRQIDYNNATKNQDLPQIPTTRGQAALLNDTRFSQNLTAHVDGNYVSDYRYLNQFGSPLALVDRRNIRSIGYLNYSGENYVVRTQVDYYQTIDPTTINANAQPYFHLPELLFSYSHGVGDTGLMFDGPTQFDAFDTSASRTMTPSGALGRTTGQRLKLRPRLYYPFQTAAGFITPSVAVQYNQYWLQDPENWTALQQNAYAAYNATQSNSANWQTYNSQSGTSESFTVPVMSLDSGTYFDRDFELSDTPMLQTLEPRMFYVYIPKVSQQQNVPTFDTTTYDYTYYQLFRENRYAGGDRVGDTNQLTLSLTSRLIDQTNGLERVRASIGNAFLFQDEWITMVGPTQAYPYQLQSNSNLIGDVYSAITPFWSLHTGGQWNPDRNQIDRGILAVQYNNKQNEILNVAYRYRRNQSTFTCINSLPNGQVNLNNGCLDLTDVSARLPIIEGWHVIGRWQYSVQDQVTVESFFGVERETCCWRFTLLGRHFISNINSGSGQTQSNNGIFIQLELKGLTSLGNQVDQFLQHQLSGYRWRENY